MSLPATDLELLSRRHWFGRSAVGALVPLAAASTVSAADHLAAKAAPPLALGKHEPVPLPFDPVNLRGLSSGLILSHHQNNYGGAIKNLNRIEAEISGLAPDAPGFLVSGLRERALAFNNSAILHEHYFGNLGGDGKPAGALVAALGDAARWEELLRQTAMGLAGGSGWVVLAFDFRRHAPLIISAQSHAQALAYGVPLLVLDMYEHSYHLDFGTQAAKYIDAFFANLNWAVVDQRYTRALAADAILDGKH